MRRMRTWIMISRPKTGANGRHPATTPSGRRSNQTLSRFGIGPGSQVVAYDQDTGMYASRLWWLLRWMGHDAVAVLDGGFAKWIAEGRPTASGDEQHAPGGFTGSPHVNVTVDIELVATLGGQRDWRLVDARAPERYRGETGPRRSGRRTYSGAINHL